MIYAIKLIAFLAAVFHAFTTIGFIVRGELHAGHAVSSLCVSVLLVWLVVMSRKDI